METDPLRVGLMPYLNSAVFYRFLPKGPWEMKEMTPKDMAAAVGRGELDAGPLPVVEVFRLENILNPLGGLCVASNGPANSVLLFSRVPVEDLDGSDVGVTSHSATSVQLMRVLFEDLWRVRPARYVGDDRDAEAYLFIGDKALRLRGRMNGYDYEYDLGEAWKRLTGLPFVFATWVVRSDAPPAATARFKSALEASFLEGMSRIRQIAEERKLPGTSGERSAEKAKAYIRNFIYRTGGNEQRGMMEFRRRLDGLYTRRPQPVDRRADSPQNAAASTERQG